MNRAQALVIATLITACASSPSESVDETGFANHVSQMIVSKFKWPDQSALVVSEESLNALPQGLQLQLKAVLDQADLRWIVATPQDWVTALEQDRSVEWTVTGITEYFLSIDVEGEGVERLVSWSMVCGPIYGYGGKEELIWQDGQWRSETLSIVMY